MQFLYYTLAFLLMLTPLVFIHELGHFLFAKIFNVKVKTFSIFMGKKLLKWKWGETEYCISSIPIGGYVSLLGEDPTQEISGADAERALFNQPFMKKFLIVAAGPVFNILSAIVIFMFIIASGEPVISNKIARIIPQSDAFHAGFQINDKILRINENPVNSFKDYMSALKPLVNQEIEVEILRGTTKKVIKVRTKELDGMDRFGDPVKIGGIDGIDIRPLNTLIGISDYNSKAYKLGLRTGDKIVSVNEKSVNLLEELRESFKSPKIDNSTYSFALIIERSGAKVPFTFKLKPEEYNNATPNILKHLGIESANLFVERLEKGYPAQIAGIQKK